jgi:hypothetical protein
MLCAQVQGFQVCMRTEWVSLTGTAGGCGNAAKCTVSANEATYSIYTRPSGSFDQRQRCDRSKVLDIPQGKY